jgi:hypothetical protein
LNLLFSAQYDLVGSRPRSRVAWSRNGRRDSPTTSRAFGTCAGTQRAYASTLMAEYLHASYEKTSSETVIACKRRGSCYFIRSRMKSFAYRLRGWTEIAPKTTQDWKKCKVGRPPTDKTRLAVHLKEDTIVSEADQKTPKLMYVVDYAMSRCVFPTPKQKRQDALQSRT